MITLTLILLALMGYSIWDMKKLYMNFDMNFDPFKLSNPFAIIGGCIIVFLATCAIIILALIVIIGILVIAP